MIVYGIQTEKKNISYIGFALSIIARQTGIIFLISFLLLKIRYRNKFFFTNLDILKIIIIFLLAFLLNNYHASKVSNASFDYEAVTGMFYFFLDNFNFKKIILFFSYILFSYFPLLLFILVRQKRNIFNEQLFLFILISIFLIFIQTILAGTDIAGKNIVRLTNLAYLMATVFASIFYDFSKNKYSKNMFYIFLVGCFFSSFHPTYNALFNLID